MPPTKPGVADLGARTLEETESKGGTVEVTARNRMERSFQWAKRTGDIVKLYMVSFFRRVGFRKKNIYYAGLKHQLTRKAHTYIYIYNCVILILREELGS